uniref:ZP domain-containing protein n=1 Tax=Pygocentrus nattereri TaxID=42514 RepID=A0AAR2LK03_PYGNA
IISLSLSLLKKRYILPDNSDITVTCGANYIYLSILLCPIYYGGYNESLVALNGRFNISACYGVADFGASTPVLNFNISISQETVSLCGNSLIVDQVDTGQLSASSRVQFVNISGSVVSQDPGNSPISYQQVLQYQFSCRYLLQHMINNTEVSVMSLAVRGNRGSFISTLSMNFFTEYTQPLQIPDDFFMLNDWQTVVDVNGVSQEARFSFEAFRFIEHQNMTVSTFYLHCITRLCENSMCSSMLPVTILLTTTRPTLFISLISDFFLLHFEKSVVPFGFCVYKNVTCQNERSAKPEHQSGPSGHFVLSLF